MERNNPVGSRRSHGIRRTVQSGVSAWSIASLLPAQAWESTEEEDPPENTLAAALEELTEVLLPSWLNHSRTLRFPCWSVCRTSGAGTSWSTSSNATVMNCLRSGSSIWGMCRGILHQGVDEWLSRLEQEGDCDLRLLR